MTGQLALFDAAQTAQNGACNAAVSARADTPQNGSGRAQNRSCAVCAGPIDPGMKITARYCGRRCKDRAEVDAAAARDHANGVCHERPRCECDHPVLVFDPDLREARDLLCGRTR